MSLIELCTINGRKSERTKRNIACPGRQARDFRNSIGKENVNKIAQVVVGLPIEGSFDYIIGKEFQQNISVGHRVKVSFNRRNRVGFVVGFRGQSPFKKLNPILSLLDNEPVVDEKALGLTKALSEYYGSSWGEAIESYLPAPLRKAQAFFWQKPVEDTFKSIPDQEKIVLFHDVSLQKRWPYLLEEIEKRIQAGQGVIFIVPEAFYMEGIQAKLKRELKNLDAARLAVFDKRLSTKQELQQWQAIKEGRISIVMGTRSAVFAPVSRLGLMVIYDEEHTAYKQEQSPHYDAREVSLWRARMEECSVIFVSSSPSVETWQRANKEKWEKITFPFSPLSKIQLVDMANYKPRQNFLFSYPLQNDLNQALQAKKKIVLFLNRRGFSTTTRCQECGFTMQCPRCNVNLTYLYSKKKLACRYCQFKRDIPKICPNCEGSYLRSLGLGIEKLESELSRLYPRARISHFDKESASFPQEADIVIATQAILKCFQGGAISEPFDLIAVLNFDAELNHADFRCAHRAFSLLVKLRALAKEKLIVQTRLTDNYCLKAAQTMDFPSFYRAELKLRKDLGLPPYRHLAAIGLRGRKEEIVFEQSKNIYEKFKVNQPKSLEISDPHPDILPKLRDKYRYTIILKSSSVKDTLKWVKKILKDFRKKQDVVMTINVDP